MQIYGGSSLQYVTTLIGFVTISIWRGKIMFLTGYVISCEHMYEDLYKFMGGILSS